MRWFVGGVRGWHESNFGMGRVGRMGPQNFDAGQMKRDQNFIVSETYDFMNLHYDSIKFYL